MVLPRADKKIKLGGVTYGISVLLKNDMIHIRAKKKRDHGFLFDLYFKWLVHMYADVCIYLVGKDN